MAEDELLITCTCSRLDHAVRFTFHEVGPHDRGAFEAYIDVCLDYERTWWGRLRSVWRYLFRRTCGYGEAAEIVVRDQDLPKIRAWVERAERDAAKRATVPA